MKLKKEINKCVYFCRYVHDEQTLTQNSIRSLNDKTWGSNVNAEMLDGWKFLRIQETYFF